MHRLTTSLLALGLLSSQPAVAQAENAVAGSSEQAEWDMIRFEVLSWGAPVTWWQFSPQYGGVWVENVTAGGAFSPAYTLAFHPLEADAGRYLALADIVGQLPDPAPDSNGCDNFMTDQAYGIIRLTRGAMTTEIAWNSGCMDPDYAAFITLLRDADTLVSAWGRAVPVGRTEEHTR